MRRIYLLLKSAAVMAACPIMLASCAISVRKDIRTLHRDSLCAQLLLPDASGISEKTGLHDTGRFLIEDSVPPDTLTILDPEGNRMFFMKATADSSGTLHATEELRGIVVSARFKNIPERNGAVRLTFDVLVPERMLNPHWQVRLRPIAVLLGDTVGMEEIHITGKEYRERQLRGYELYNRFLSGIITDSSELVYSGLLEIFIERNIPQLAELKNDSSLVNPDLVRGLYGISFRTAREHYFRRLLIHRNNRRQERLPDMFGRYVRDPFIEEGIRIDSVITDSCGDIVYCYSQSFKTRAGLRKIDLILEGQIFHDGEARYRIPASEPLTFYVSSFSTLAESKEKYITRVIRRRVTENTAATLDFRPGEYVLDKNYSSNMSGIRHIKSVIDGIIQDRTFVMDSLVITASCSPEGGYELNSRLARQRGDGIAGFLKDYVMDLSAGAVTDSSTTPGRFIVKHIPENWNRLAELILLDSLIIDKTGLVGICRLESPDTKENILSRHAEYPYIKENLYPALREVKFDFYLHRRGMVKDTIVTTEPDTVYYAGLQAIRDRDYRKAIQYLGHYRDLNSAIAFLALDYNASAMQILESLPPSGKRDYLLAVAHSRCGNERMAVEYFSSSTKLDPSMTFRGNLDPEISRLIDKYNILPFLE